MIKIAATETYDPTLCVESWINRVQGFDFVLYITKVLNPHIIKLLTDGESPISYQNKASVIHLTCTGWGGTFLEPNVVSRETFKDKAAQLIAAGYPKDRLVWRVDPIIPIKEGLEKFKASVDLAISLGIYRIRASVMQLYKHSYERIKETPIIDEINSIYKGKFWPDKDASWEFMVELLDIVQSFKEEHSDISFEACASSMLHKCGFKDIPCMSEFDLNINGFEPNSSWGMMHGTQRAGCSCLLKQQLIPGGFSRGRCPNKCLYCYLKDKEEKEVESEILF